ncbi:Tectonic-1 [Borealophlyctis nickersoniae]|nr:Tectonic-1 [Borealophlyctis nickersoniae]
MNPAKFLAGTTTSCARPVQCAPNTVFDAAYYTSGFVIVTDPSSTGKTIPLTINAPTCIDPVTGIQTPCFSPTTLPTPLWNATASVCSQVVLQVRYTFTYSVYITTTIITAATVDLAFGQISAGASSVLQTFSTVYVVPPTNVSTLPVPKSGNPGYIVGKPLLVGTLVKNGNQSAIAYTPNPQYGLTVPTDVFFSGSTTPSCPPAGSRSQRLPVLFGYDSLAGCTLSYTREDLTNNCAVIRGRVLEVQTLAVAGITHVGRFGNASWEDLEGWVQISNDNSSATAVLGTPDPAGTCSSLLTELDIQILTAPLGSKINPQPAILAMRINYVLGRFQYRCTTPLDCATVPVPPATTPQQSFRIKTTVSFVEIENRPEMLVPPAPRIVPPLPQDVFYPFKIGGSGKGLDGQKWRILFGFGVGLVLVL